MMIKLCALVVALQVVLCSGQSVEDSSLACGCEPSMCTRNYVVRSTRPVVDECIKHVPILRKRVCQKVEHVTRHVPVMQKIVASQIEKYINHVPIVQKVKHTVVEENVRNVPVSRKRVRKVTDVFTSHVPVKKNVTRVVVDTIVKYVPVVKTRLVPIVNYVVRQVPVTVRRIRPVVEQYVTQVPVRRQIIKNVVEQQVVAHRGPCCSCGPQSYLPYNAYNYGHTSPSYLPVDSCNSFHNAAFSGASGGASIYKVQGSTLKSLPQIPFSNAASNYQPYPSHLSNWGGWSGINSVGKSLPSSNLRYPSSGFRLYPGYIPPTSCPVPTPCTPTAFPVSVKSLLVDGIVFDTRVN